MKFAHKIVFLGLVLAGLLQANTSVIVYNQTPFDIQVTWRGQDGGDALEEGKNRWTGGPITLVSGQIYQDVVKFARNVGIKNGSTYWFKETIALPKADGSGTFQTVNLKQKITGKSSGSSIEISAIEESKNNSAPWHDSGRNYLVVKDSNQEFIITYYFVSAGTYNNVVYVIDYRDPNAFKIDPVGDNGVNVLMYNLYMRSGEDTAFYNGQNTRGTYIPGMIGGGFDVVIFCEAFATKPRETLMSGMVNQGYKYYTDPIGYNQGASVSKAGTVSVDNGGVVVMSRWPIEEKQEFLFGDTCTGSDCLARKGVWYVRINKNGKKYHIIAAHTNAWEGAEQANVRGAQFIIMRSVIDRKKIPANEPVIIGGDFNVNMLKSDQTEFNRMLYTLNAFLPRRNGGHPYTVDARINKLAVQDNVDKIPYANVNPANPTAPNTVDIEWLDYLLIPKSYRQPNSSSFIRPIIAKTSEDMQPKDKDFNDKTTMFDGSDHQPVAGHFVYDGY